MRNILSIYALYTQVTPSTFKYIYYITITKLKLKKKPSEDL